MPAGQFVLTLECMHQYAGFDRRFWESGRNAAVPTRSLWCRAGVCALCARVFYDANRPVCARLHCDVFLGYCVCKRPRWTANVRCVFCVRDGVMWGARGGEQFRQCEGVGAGREDGGGRCQLPSKGTDRDLGARRIQASLRSVTGDCCSACARPNLYFSQYLCNLCRSLQTEQAP